MFFNQDDVADVELANERLPEGEVVAMLRKGIHGIGEASGKWNLVYNRLVAMSSNALDSHLCRCP